MKCRAFKGAIAHMARWIAVAAPDVLPGAIDGKLDDICCGGHRAATRVDHLNLDQRNIIAASNCSYREIDSLFQSNNRIRCPVL